MTPAPRIHVTLEDLAREPTRVAEVPAEQVLALLAQVGAVQAVLQARAAVAWSSPSAEAATEDRLLTVTEAADVLGVKVHSLYRGAKEGRYPFTVRLGPRQLRFSSRGVQAFLRERQKRLDG